MEQQRQKKLTKSFYYRIQKQMYETCIHIFLQYEYYNIVYKVKQYEIKK